jgi:hypothetical protein
VCLPYEGESVGVLPSVPKKMMIYVMTLIIDKEHISDLYDDIYNEH